MYVCVYIYIYIIHTSFIGAASGGGGAGRRGSAAKASWLLQNLQTFDFPKCYRESTTCSVLGWNINYVGLYDTVLIRMER